MDRERGMSMREKKKRGGGGNAFWVGGGMQR